MPSKPVVFFYITLPAITLILIWKVSWYGRVNEIQQPRILKGSGDVTLENLHNKIWKQIESLQEDGDCKEKKILHCENYHYAGFGSMAMRYGMCMQVAFGLGRMFLIHQKEYAHFGGISRFLRNESTKCGHLKNTYQITHGNGTCNVHDPRCYLSNGYELDNSYKVLVMQDQTGPGFPGPRRIPTTLPLEIEKDLNNLKIKKPWLWFTSQFLGYLILRLQPEFKAKMERFRREMNMFEYPLAAIHIRGGKDKLRESDRVPNEKHLSVVDKYFRQNLPNMKRPNIYIASDVIEIVDQLKVLRPNYRFFQLPRSYVKHVLYKTELYNQKDFPKECLESILLDLHFLVYANYSVCYHTSNVCRLLWSLKLATSPYMENRVADVKGHDIHIWRYGIPHNDGRPTYVAKRNSTFKNVTFSDGVNCTYHFSPSLSDILLFFPLFFLLCLGWMHQFFTT